MPSDFSRSARVAEEVRRVLSDAIRQGVRDPRVGMVTITDVQLSRDFAHGKIFVSVLELAAGDTEAGPEATIAASIEALNRAAGFLRGELGRRMKLRNIPALRFIEDPTEREAVRMDSLIRDVRKADDEAAQRRGDEVAGGSGSGEEAAGQEESRSDDSGNRG